MTFRIAQGMRGTRKAIAVAACIALGACQTLDGPRENGTGTGPEPRVQEAQAEEFCERYLVLCVVGGVVIFVAGAVILGDFIAAEN
jgi:hypothetical protein